jgi:hypothetical protein
MMQMWAVVEDLPEVVNAEVDEADTTHSPQYPMLLLCTVQTDEVLEDVEPPKEPPEPQRDE